MSTITINDELYRNAESSAKLSNYYLNSYKRQRAPRKRDALLLSACYINVDINKRSQTRGGSECRSPRTYAGR